MKSKLLSPIQSSGIRLHRLAFVIWTAVGITLLVGALGWVFSYVGSVFYPFIYAGVIAYLLRPIVERLVAMGLPRLMAVLLTYVLVFAVLALLLEFIVPVIIQQIMAFVNHFPAYSRAVVTYFNLARSRYLRINLPGGSTRIINQLASNLRDRGLALFQGLPEASIGIFGGLLNLILAPVIAFYVLKDLPVIRATLLELFPERHRDNVAVVLHQVDFVLGGFLRGQALVSLVVALTTGLALWIAGINFPLLLGLLTGMLNIIPYFGPIAGGAAAATVALFQSPMKALIVIVIMFVVQQLDGMIISPVIMKHAVDLHPTVIIFSLLLGGAVFGFVGLLVAIPVAAVVKALVMYFFYPNEELPLELVEEGAPL